MASQMMQSICGHSDDGFADGDLIPGNSELVPHRQSLDLAGMSMEGAFMPSPAATGQADGLLDMPQPYQFNQLNNWVRDSDDPWNPERGAPIKDRGISFGYPECGINAPSDSGYGTNSNYVSLAQPSVHDGTFDLPRDLAQSQVGDLEDIPQHGHDGLGSPTEASEWPQPSRSEGRSDLASVQTGKSPLWCSVCNVMTKNNSDLKKHHQRHTKPFRCEEERCDRKIGFSTQNDLDRHKNSKHPGSVPDGKRYVCGLCPVAKKTKSWPRADNFRSHLQKIHQREVLNLEEFERKEPQLSVSAKDSGTLAPHDAILPDLVRVSSQAFGYNRPPTLSSPDSDLPIDIGDSSQDEHLNAADLITRPMAGSIMDSRVPSAHNAWPTMTLTLAMVEKHVLTSRPTGNAGLPRRPTQFPAGFQSASITNNHGRTGQTRTFPPEPAAQQIGHVTRRHGREQQVHSLMPTKEVFGGPSMDFSHLEKEEAWAPNSQAGERLSSHCAINSKKDATGLIDRMSPSEQKLLLDTLQERHKAKDSLSDSSSQSADSPHVAVSNARFPCAKCDKRFQRRSDLKKHVKRHDRPYGCTVESCAKTFGSKNDWKRHETGQHEWPELWRCAQRSLDGSSAQCHTVYGRRDRLVQHLKLAHEMSSSAVDLAADRSRLSLDEDSCFWCGFCREVVSVNDKGKLARTKRFDHIDDHLFGREDKHRFLMSEWQKLSTEATPAIKASSPDSEGYSTARSSLSPDRSQINSGKLGKRKCEEPQGSASTGKRSKRRKETTQLMAVRCCHCDEYNMSKNILMCTNVDCQHVLNDCCNRPR